LSQCLKVAVISAVASSLPQANGSNPLPPHSQDPGQGQQVSESNMTFLYEAVFRGRQLGEAAITVTVSDS
jgi:hypothetical protein